MEGSLINWMMGGLQHPVPEVGMGATELCWSDRHPYTIIEISKSGKRMKVQADIAIRTDNNGMSESQEYEYKRDPEGAIRTLYLTKTGKWRELKGICFFSIGSRSEYYDFSF